MVILLQVPEPEPELELAPFGHETVFCSHEFGFLTKKTKIKLFLKNPVKKNF